MRNGKRDSFSFSFSPFSPMKNSRFPRTMENSDIYFYDIDTWCPFQRQMITLTLRSNRKYEGLIVAGKPIQCSFQDKCDKKDNARCYLKSIRIESRRK